MPTPPPSLTDDHVTAWARLVRASDRVLRAVETDLKAAGLPCLSWYDLLLELRRAGAKGLRPFQIQEALLLPQYNVSRLIDRVVTAGHAARCACDVDARGQIVHLTPAGEDLLRAMWPVYKATLERELAARLDAAEAATLATLLGKLT